MLLENIYKAIKLIGKVAVSLTPLLHYAKVNRQPKCGKVVLTS